MSKRFTDEQKYQASRALAVLSAHANRVGSAMNHINKLVTSEGYVDDRIYSYITSELDWVITYYNRGLECARRVGVQEDIGTKSQVANSLTEFFRITDLVVIGDKVRYWHMDCKASCRTLSDIAQYDPSDWHWW